MVRKLTRRKHPAIFRKKSVYLKRPEPEAAFLAAARRQLNDSALFGANPSRSGHKSDGGMKLTSRIEEGALSIGQEVRASRRGQPWHASSPWSHRDGEAPASCGAHGGRPFGLTKNT